MWTIIKYYIFTRNNLLMLILFYPFFLTLSKIGGLHIASAMSNIDIVLYPFIYFGFFVNTEKASLEKLPIHLDKIRYAKSSSLYLITLFMLALNLILISILDELTLTAVAYSFFRVNILFALAILFSKVIFQNYIPFKAEEFKTIPFKSIPLLVFIALHFYVFQDNYFIQIALSLVFYPIFEFWDFYIITKYTTSKLSVFKA